MPTVIVELLSSVLGVSCSRHLPSDKLSCVVCLCVTATDAVCSSTTDLSTTQPSSGRLPQLEAGTLVANTPVGVYRHQLRAVREKLRLEVARSLQYSAEAQLAREQLKAETDARTAIQVSNVRTVICFHLTTTKTTHLMAF